MGCEPSKNNHQLSKKELVVATLNYCAIMNSPFEFYCQDFEKQLYQISHIFASLLPEYFPNFVNQTFKWSMGKIDVKIRSGRYSPQFSIDAGIENSHFVTRNRFSELWDQSFNAEQKKIGQKFPNQQRESAKLFDFISFHTLLIFVYKNYSFDELVKQNPALYQQKLKPFFQLSFLDQKKKLDTIVKNFQSMKVDVFFVQQFSKQFERYIDQNHDYIKATDPSKDTMIIAKKSSFRDFRKIETVLLKDEIQRLNWAGRTCFLCLDNFILLNAHLTSKSAKNKPQIQDLKNSLINLKNEHPLFNIILGGDLNSFLSPNEKLNAHFEMFPNQERCLTTCKKRTIAQVQFNKGNKIIRESKDKIITNLKLKDCKVVYINGNKPNEDDLVPRNDHPFDHFVVTATVYK